MRQHIISPDQCGSARRALICRHGLTLAPHVASVASASATNVGDEARLAAEGGGGGQGGREEGEDEGEEERRAWPLGEEQEEE